MLGNGLLDLSQYYQGGIQFDYTAMYDQKRQQATWGGISQIFDVIGGIGSRFAEASAAEDYAEKVQAAKDRAYQNAMTIANASAESMLKVATYNKDLLEQNAFSMEANASNLRTAAEKEKSLGYGGIERQKGEVKTAYAASGISVRSTSVSDFLNNVTEVGERNVDAKYSQRVNQVREALDSATRMKMEGAMAVWSAKEQGKFMLANAQQRLY